MASRRMKYFVCYICPTPFDRIGNLELHFKRSHGPEAFNPKLCKIHFGYSLNLVKIALSQAKVEDEQGQSSRKLLDPDDSHQKLFCKKRNKRKLDRVHGSFDKGAKRRDVEKSRDIANFVIDEVESSYQSSTKIVPGAVKPNEICLKLRNRHEVVVNRTHDVLVVFGDNDVAIKYDLLVEAKNVTTNFVENLPLKSTFSTYLLYEFLPTTLGLYKIRASLNTERISGCHVTVNVCHENTVEQAPKDPHNTLPNVDEVHHLKIQNSIKSTDSVESVLLEVAEVATKFQLPLGCDNLSILTEYLKYLNLAEFVLDKCLSSWTH